MVQTGIDPARELQRAADLLIKNWMLAIPTAFASLVIALFAFFVLASVFASAMVGGLAAGRGGAGIAALLAAGPLLLAFVIVAAVLVAVAQAVVVRASEDVWEGKPVDLGASLNAVLGRIAPLFGVFVLAFLILVIPIALSVFLIGIPIVLVVGFFLMYAVPAVVLGGESASGAIAASYNIARANVGPSVVAFAGIIVALVVGGIINAIFQHFGVLSVLVQFAVGGLTSAYAALVAARFYMLLRQGAPAA
jgi:hypothetical protein